MTGPDPLAGPGATDIPADTRDADPAGTRGPDPAAVPVARRDAPGVTEADVATLAEQLGRPPRGLVGVAARCVCGRPLVVRTAPRLPDGTPFPTTYYLTSPPAVAAVSTLEAGGLMREQTERLAADPALAAAYRRAHEAYLADRAALAGPGEVPEIDGVSAGGMPTRVKCLHALVGHALAAGPGVNPIGDETLLLLAPVWRPDRCSC